MNFNGRLSWPICRVVTYRVLSYILSLSLSLPSFTSSVRCMPFLYYLSCNGKTLAFSHHHLHRQQFHQNLWSRFAPTHGNPLRAWLCRQEKDDNNSLRENETVTKHAIETKIYVHSNSHWRARIIQDAGSAKMSLFLQISTCNGGTTEWCNWHYRLDLPPVPMSSTAVCFLPPALPFISPVGHYLLAMAIDPAETSRCSHIRQTAHSDAGKRLVAVSLQSMAQLGLIWTNKVNRHGGKHVASGVLHIPFNNSLTYMDTHDFQFHCMTTLSRALIRSPIHEYQHMQRIRQNGALALQNVQTIRISFTRKQLLWDWNSINIAPQMYQ